MIGNAKWEMIDDVELRRGNCDHHNVNQRMWIYYPHSLHMVSTLRFLNSSFDLKVRSWYFNKKYKNCCRHWFIDYEYFVLNFYFKAKQTEYWKPESGYWRFWKFKKLWLRASEFKLKNISWCTGWVWINGAIGFSIFEIGISLCRYGR